MARRPREGLNLHRGLAEDVLEEADPPCRSFHPRSLHHPVYNVKPVRGTADGSVHRFR